MTSAEEWAVAWMASRVPMLPVTVGAWITMVPRTAPGWRDAPARPGTRLTRRRPPPTPIPNPKGDR